MRMLLLRQRLANFAPPLFCFPQQWPISKLFCHRFPDFCLFSSVVGFPYCNVFLFGLIGYLFDVVPVFLPCFGCVSHIGACELRIMWVSRVFCFDANCHYSSIAMFNFCDVLVKISFYRDCHSALSPFVLHFWL